MQLKNFPQHSNHFVKASMCQVMVPSLPLSGPRRDESPDISLSPQIGLSPDEIQLCVANQWIAPPQGPIMVAFSGVQKSGGRTNRAIIFSILNKSILFTLGTFNLQTAQGFNSVFSRIISISPYLTCEGEISSVFDNLPWFNIKMLSYQYRKSHCGDKTMLRPSHLQNKISQTGKTTSLYWIWGPGSLSL